MHRKKFAALAMLPLALAACDNSQPTYSASNANSAAPPPPVTAPPPPPPAPVEVAAAPAAVPTPAPALPAAPPKLVAQPRPTQWFAQVAPGKLGDLPKLGVGSCDDYVQRYRTCFNATEIPRGEKFQVRRDLMQQVRKWKQDVVQGKVSQVAVECTDAAHAARERFVKLGCKTF
jgi:hypothetical protein